MVGSDVDASSGADAERMSSRGSIRPRGAWSARAGIPLAASSAARVAFALHAAVEQGRPGRAPPCPGQLSVLARVRLAPRPDHRPLPSASASSVAFLHTQ